MDFMERPVQGIDIQRLVQMNENPDGGRANCILESAESKEKRCNRSIGFL
jgi:hypothetical protein